MKKRRLQLTEAERKRFASKFTRGPVDECWPWQGTRFANGYAAFWLDGQNQLAHRVMYVDEVGLMPEDEPNILHTCDNGAGGCVNPHHLEAGTQTKNMLDRDARGRHWVQHGEAHPEAKLTEQDVRDVRAIRRTTGETYVSIAERYGVTDGAIRAIVHGRTWKHVKEAA